MAQGYAGTAWYWCWGTLTRLLDSTFQFNRIELDGGPFAFLSHTRYLRMSHWYHICLFFLCLRCFATPPQFYFVCTQKQCLLSPHYANCALKACTIKWCGPSTWETKVVRTAGGGGIFYRVGYFFEALGERGGGTKKSWSYKKFFFFPCHTSSFPRQQCMLFAQS